jgi:hypothetical protein
MEFGQAVALGSGTDPSKEVYHCRLVPTSTASGEDTAGIEFGGHRTEPSRSRRTNILDHLAHILRVQRLPTSAALAQCEAESLGRHGPREKVALEFLAP